MQLSKSQLNHSDIGRKLQVDKIVSGSILVEEDTMQLNFELLDINSGEVLWSDSWTDLIVNTNNIRKNILDGALGSLDIEISKELLDSLSEAMSLNADAIYEYNKGKNYCLEFLEKKSDLDQAKEHINSALLLDDEFVDSIALHPTGRDVCDVVPPARVR